MPVSLFGAARPSREANPRCFSWIRTYEKTNDLLHFDFESTYQLIDEKFLQVLVSGYIEFLADVVTRHVNVVFGFVE